VHPGSNLTSRRLAIDADDAQIRRRVPDIFEFAVIATAPAESCLVEEFGNPWSMAFTCRCRVQWGWLLAGTLVFMPGRAETVSLAPVFVTSSRGAEAADAVPFSHETLTAEAVRRAPAVTLDGALRGIPGFSLFRRTDSLVANPTTQGVSLRGLGPSGASRSLVLLDGVPLNDPFGGWVLWSKVPRESLAGIEVVPGGGGAAWGNAALGGVIQLFTNPASGRRERVMAAGGSFNTWETEAEFTEPVGSGTLQLLGRFFDTDGFETVAAENRGPIDTPVSSRSRWLTARWRQPLGANADVTFTARAFGEERGNGTPYQRNTSRETFGSVVIAVRPTATFRWTGTAYAQDQNYSSTFSSVNAARTAETPASDQFAVPTLAIGGAWTGEWSTDHGTRTTAGVDVRDVRGETREDSGYVDDAFTKRRLAGGRQSNAGLFLLHSRALSDTVRASLGLRADGWLETDGHRRDFTEGVPAGEEVVPRREGLAFSPSAGVVWQPAGPVRLHAAAQRAFRRPTLNELYRPFRVGNVITDANPYLRTETVTSAEIGATVTRGAFTFDATAFWNDLHDAVANVTLAQGPVTLPGIGFVPAGGEGRRRLNLDRTRVEGVALSAQWRISPALAADARYLWDDTTVTRATVATPLEGLRLAQVPLHSATVGLTWQPACGWTVTPRLRWIGEQFENDLNTLRLAPVTIVDLSLQAMRREGCEVFLTAENLGNRRVETGRSASGLVNTGTPRLILLGVRLSR
jgi:outer membrane receptor protein involved in Fe transport